LLIWAFSSTSHSDQFLEKPILIIQSVFVSCTSFNCITFEVLSLLETTATSRIQRKPKKATEKIVENNRDSYLDEQTASRALGSSFYISIVTGALVSLVGRAL
jgi:hypothetical protein